MSVPLDRRKHRKYQFGSGDTAYLLPGVFRAVRGRRGMLAAL